MGRSVDDLPSLGPPGGFLVKKSEAGEVIQRRTFDADGRAAKDIDFDHDYEGVGRPHAHDWDWSKRRVRQRARPLGPGEV